MSWSDTPEYTAIDVLSRLWNEPAWRASDSAGRIESVLRAKLSDQDDVVRYHAARVAASLAADGLAFVTELLHAEYRIEVATVLLTQLGQFRDERPAAVDEVVRTLAGGEPWATLLAQSDRDSDLVDAFGAITSLVLYLALRHQTPAASFLARKWMDEPTATEASRRAVVQLRGWLRRPGDERRRAFELLDVAVSRLTTLRESGKDQAEVFRLADTAAHTLYSASGAYAPGDEPPSPPDPGFTEEALVVLQKLAQFKYPALTHVVVETSAHLAPDSPARVFHVVAAAVGNGDEYTYDTLAADETISLVQRYFTEFSSAVMADDDLLSAVRSVLGAFVSVGWPSAISLAYRLSDTFR
ncbi:hypothetical protein [Amycolatopsis sp. NPDC050768]|uniref:hypothetical protein n=1 Tax=Amycolatopsis sp. NPDC050768 TaxID=3154839 RepID=UPI0033E2BD50